MVHPRKTWEKIRSGTRTVRFGEFEQVLKAFGFRHVRTSGSHRIYTHPGVNRPLSVQPRQGEAKPYQVRQFLDMVEEFGLRMDRGRE